MKTRLERLPYGLLRAPAYSLDRLLQIQSSDAALRTSLSALFQEPYARDALFYMAPEFLERLGGTVDATSANPDELLTLLKYANRLCFRATPLGLSATVSTAYTAAASTMPSVASRDDVRIEVALDDCVLERLIDRQCDGAEALAIEWIANDTRYAFGSKLRYFKLSASRDEAPKPMLSSVETNKYLLAALEFAQTTPRTLTQITTHLLTRFPDELTDAAEVLAYLNSMVDQQLLTRDHLYALTDSRIAQSEFARFHGDKSAAIENAMKGIASRAITVANGVRAIREGFDKLLLDVPSKSVVRLNAWRDSAPDSGYPAALVMKMDRTVEAFIKVLHSLPSPFENMLARWDELHGDADLPLMMVVDEANGLYQETARGRKGILGELPQPRMRARKAVQLIRQQLVEQYVAGIDEIDVSLQDIEKLDLQAEGPNAATAWFRLWRDANGTDQLELTGFGTSQAGRLMGRFALDDDRIATMLRSLAEKRRSENVVTAELVWHPRVRTANVCRRPVLSDYEVTVRSGASSAARSLPLSDILVCRRNGYLKLRSKSLGKWIDLTMSCAHNHELRSNLMLYRFLNEVIGQYGHSIDEVIPRSYFGDAVTTPRVKIDGVTVERASYKLTAAVMKCLRSNASDSEAKHRIGDFCLEHRVPAWTVHAENDNQMLVRMDSDMGVQYLRSIARKSRDCVLTEFGPAEWTPALAGPDGAYNHEYLVHYVAPASVDIESPRHRVAADSTGSLSDGDARFDTHDWLYHTFTIKPIFQNAFLLRFWDEVIFPLRKRSLAESAFFVRYAGPVGPTLRIRFQLAEPSGYAQAAAQVHAWWTSERSRGDCVDMRAQSYTPEVNRYGGVAGLAIAHRLFNLNSDWTIQAIHSSADLRIKAFLSVNTLLDGIGLDISQRRDFARRHAKSFGDEYHIGKSMRADVERAAKETSRALSQMTPSEVQSMLLHAEHDAAAQLRAQDGLSLCQDAKTIVSHIIHMNFNRLFAQEPRAQEAQLWDVIRRIYENPQFSSTIANLDECIGRH